MYRNPDLIKKKLDLTWRKFRKFNHDIENFDLIQQKLFWSNPDSDIHNMYS